MSAHDAGEYIWLSATLQRIDSSLSLSSLVSTDYGNNNGLPLPNNNDNGASSSSGRDVSRGYDVVVVVHHDDMETLINHGLQSFDEYLVDLDKDARLYAICTKEAEAKLNLLKREHMAGGKDGDIESV